MTKGKERQKRKMLPCHKQRIWGPQALSHHSRTQMLKRWQTFLGSNVTGDGDCSREIKRWLLLGRKAMTNPDSIKKRRDHIVNKGPYSQSYGFPVVMYRYKSWTIKKVECQRIDAFELWGWKRLLRVSWTSRRSNQSILKEINPEYSLEALVLKLKL